MLAVRAELAATMDGMLRVSRYIDVRTRQDLINVRRVIGNPTDGYTAYVDINVTPVEDVRSRIVSVEELEGAFFAMAGSGSSGFIREVIGCERGTPIWDKRPSMSPGESITVSEVTEVIMGDCRIPGVYSLGVPDVTPFRSYQVQREHPRTPPPATERDANSVVRKGW